MLRHHFTGVGIGALCILTLAACQEDGNVTRRVLTSPSPSFGLSTNERTPTAFTVATCGSDVVVLTGEMHLVSRSTIDESGGLHIGMHTNGHYSGAGASGTLYMMNLDNNQVFNMPAGAEEFTSVTQQVIVSKGREPNFAADLVIHSTINANGEPTADRFELRQRCSG